MSMMQTAQGLLGVGTIDDESPSGAFFDFVECFGLTLLSMGTIAAEQRGSRLDAPPTKSILPPRPNVGFAALPSASSLEGDSIPQFRLMRRALHCEKRI